MSTPGYLVKTSCELLSNCNLTIFNTGRTFHDKGNVNNKVPVYLETSDHEYAEQAILCDPLSLTKIGYID